MTRGVGGKGPANIMKHLGGINFPAHKDDIIEHARQGEGPDTDAVLGVLNQIEDREYTSPAEVLKQVGEVE
jgi:hypothetical protein